MLGSVFLFQGCLLLPGQAGHTKSTIRLSYLLTYFMSKSMSTLVERKRV
jgi:hypothetical protein